MYVDSKPVSGYGDTQGWMLPTPQPSGTLRRPPLLSNVSSSSSLSGMEQVIPSFRSFVNRTPLVDNGKSLPPIPVIPRRASSASPPRSMTESSYSGRRSSSVYSRTVSQWFEDDSSWRSVDLRDEAIPPLPTLQTLQPVAYSKSSPELAERPATPPPPMLEPRTYRPLINTPSPTASRQTTPNLSPVASPAVSLERSEAARRSSIMPGTFPITPIPEEAGQKVQTVSLEKAKAAVNSPGAVHLLPEEMRAQQLAKLAKSKSHGQIRVATSDFFTHFTPHERPEAPTLVDHNGRHRSLQSPKWLIESPGEYPFPISQSPSMTPDKPMPPHRLDWVPPASPLEKQPRQASQAKVIQALGIDESDEEGERPRGRTRQRGPRSMEYAHYLPKAKGKRVSPSEGSVTDPEMNDARHVASEYHDMLYEQHRQQHQRQVSFESIYDSEDNVRGHMKMIPQPLVFTPKGRPPAGLTRSMGTGVKSRQGSEASESVRAESLVSARSTGSHGEFPMQLSLRPEERYRRTLSTSGSIPISPPSRLQMHQAPAPPPTIREQSVAGRSVVFKQSKKSAGRRSEDERASMRYPYVASRKSSNARVKKASKSKSKTRKEDVGSPKPLMAADIIAQRSNEEEKTPASSPLQRTTSASQPSFPAAARKRSITSTDSQRKPLLSRLAGNAAKYADLIIKPSILPSLQTSSPKSSNSDKNIKLVSPDSPHLFPSPMNSNSASTASTPVHLGWSPSAKKRFDRARASFSTGKDSPGSPSTLRSQGSYFTQLPARPLDERRVARDGEEGGNGSGSSGALSRGSGVLGGLMEGWKERKREERREGLKRVIRVVPQAPPGGMKVIDVQKGGGWEV